MELRRKFKLGDRTQLIYITADPLQSRHTLLQPIRIGALARPSQSTSSGPFKKTSFRGSACSSAVLRPPPPHLHLQPDDHSPGALRAPPSKALLHHQYSDRGELGAVKAKLEAVETKLEETENQVLVLQEKEAPNIVFSAGIGDSGAIGPFSTSKTLIYTRVITNVGNAYNQHTGIFAAPIRGMYYFSFFYHAGGGEAVELRLMKNNQVVVASFDHKSSYDGADNGGNAAFLVLQQGDQVYVQLLVNRHVWGNPYGTTFSGFLLHKV